VKNAEDLRVVRYLFSHRTIAPHYEDFERVDRLWNGWGMACAVAPCCVCPLQRLLTRWAGLPLTVELLADAREEMEETFACLEEADDPIFQILCSSPARLIIFPENLSGEVTGRNLLRRYAIPYWQRRVEQLHRAGKLVALHNDGTLRASLPLLLDAGLDAVESVTPAPVGDMTVEEIRTATARKAVVWGGLPGALFSPLYSEDFFVAHIRHVLDVFPPGSGFILASADQVPPDATLSRIRLVREIAEEKTATG